MVQCCMHSTHNTQHTQHTQHTDAQHTDGAVVNAQHTQHRTHTQMVHAQHNTYIYAICTIHTLTRHYTIHTLFSTTHIWAHTEHDACTTQYTVHTQCKTQHRRKHNTRQVLDKSDVGEHTAPRSNDSGNRKGAEFFLFSHLKAAWEISYTLSQHITIVQYLLSLFWLARGSFEQEQSGKVERNDKTETNLARPVGK